MSITDNQIAVECFLFNRLYEDGIWYLTYIQNKEINRLSFIADRKPETARLFHMTPQEQLFAGFFANEKQQVKDMDDLNLRAHREELAKIAFEARARLTAVDDEERDRRAKRKGASKIFGEALETDDITSNAIATVNERKKKMSKTDKLIENMLKLPGMDRETAEKLVTAGSLKAELDKKFGISKANSVEENKPIVNPFASSPSSSPSQTPNPIEVSIQEDTQTIVVKETVEVEKKAFVNPFSK